MILQSLLIASLSLIVLLSFCFPGAAKVQNYYKDTFEKGSGLQEYLFICNVYLYLSKIPIKKCISWWRNIRETRLKNHKYSLHDIGVFIGLGNACMVRVARSGMKDDANPGVQSNTQQLLSSIWNIYC